MSGPPVTPEAIERVLASLGHLPATKAVLAARTGYSTRLVEAVIEHVRSEGLALVASSSAAGRCGYWTPQTLDEAEANVERRYRRALTQLGTVGGERRLIARLRESGDLTLWSPAA